MNFALADKAVARRHFLSQRRHLSTAVRRFAAESVKRHLSPMLPHAAWLLAYQPLGSELSISASIDEAVSLGLSVTLPSKYDDPAVVAASLAEQPVAPGKLPLALLPGIAYDPYGTRLGRGAGFYDRLLASLPHSVVRVGVAFSCQTTAHLSRFAHDMPVDALLSERGLLLCGGSRPQARAFLKTYCQPSADEAILL